MSIAGGPRLEGIGRTGDSDLMLCLDALDASSYPGEPSENDSYNNGYTNSITLGQNNSWVNSGAATYTNGDTAMTVPPGFEKTRPGNNLWVNKCETTTAGSQHFGAGQAGVSASTEYTVSLWYRQNRAGVGSPYMRGNVQNTNIGTLSYKGVTSASNWPVNEWIRITATATTASNETSLYISNYLGSQVGDTAWNFGPQIEEKSYMTPLILTTTRIAPTDNRTATAAWKDLSQRGNNGNFTNDLWTGSALSRKGQVLTSFYNGPNPAFRNYIDFDGTDDSITVSITNMHINQMPSFTLSAWVMSNSISTSQNIISRNGPYFMRITSSTLRMGVYVPASGGWMFTNGPTTLSSNVWYNFVITYDQINATMYINGDLEKTVAKTGPVTANGGQYLGYTPAVGEQASFDGLMGKIDIYKVGLTAAQVRANFNANRSRFGA